MSPFLRFSLFPSLLLVTILAAPIGAAPQQGVAASLDDPDRILLPGSVTPMARPEADVGRASPSLQMGTMTLQLRLRPDGDTDLEALLREQQDPKSPEFHQWLSPKDFGLRFGLDTSEIDQVVQWLQDSGLTIQQIGTGRQWITFTGTSAHVEQAFKTRIDEFRDEQGVIHHANVSDVSIPKTLGRFIRGPVALHDFEPFPLSRRIGALPTPMPQANGTYGSHFLAPADFATIYNLNPLYSSGINGSGQTIAIVGRTDINISDVRTFRSTFGLPSNDPVIVHNGPPPGDLGSDEEAEGLLDVDWSGAVAPRSTVKFVITANASGGILSSAQYVVDHNLAPILSVSFLLCESSMGTSAMNFVSSLWSQAAAEGISVFVASGDSGAAGCESGASAFGSARAVNGIGSSPNNVCVGGTAFNDTSNPSAYWSSTENSITHGSAKSYIPEVGWNESAFAGGSGLWSSGGGQSLYFSKPPWQVAPGVPGDGRRDVPDVSLSAAGHDAYLIARSGKFEAWDGTSAASPSMAGIAALVLQKTGMHQGNLNPRLYQMANAQYEGAGPTVFHDVTGGSNSVTDVTGFFCGRGYDLVTGLGSVDATALANNWSIATGDRPNLAPYQPSKWSAPIVLSKVKGSTVDSAPIFSSDPLYLDWAIQNDGKTSTSGKFYGYIYLDNVYMSSWSGSDDRPLPPSYYDYWSDISIGKLTAGSHTIKLVADPTNAIAESNEADNTYSTTITVFSPGQTLPNLQPYTPPYWSGPLVISTFRGAVTDADSMNANDFLFVNWGVSNAGAGPTTTPFPVSLLVDGHLVSTGQVIVSSPLNPGAYKLATDIPVGKLAFGTHTFRLVADPGNAIHELNENDNVYTQTIDIKAAPCDKNIDPRCGVHIIVPRPRSPRR